MPPERTTHVVPVAAGATHAGEQRGHADRPGAFDVELRPLHQQHHRVRDRLLVDRDDLVDPAFDEGPRDRTGRLHGDAVGERRDRTNRRPRARRTAHTQRPGRHDPNRGRRRLDRDRQPGRQPTAPDRDDDQRQIVDVLEQLQPERALAGDHDRIVERMTERPARGGRSRFGGLDRFHQRRAAFGDGRAERKTGLDLADRGPGRHEDLAPEPEVLGRERDRLGMVAGASGALNTGSTSTSGG